MTGTPVSFNRDMYQQLILTLKAKSGTYVFVAYGELADRLETTLFTYRQQKRAITITVQYDPSDGQTILSFSIVT
jgi:hypothetical protein